MSKLKLSWTPPITNTDGSPITNKLNYELGLKNASGEFVPLLAVVGNLQPDQTYEAAIDNDNIPAGVELELALRAINTKDTDLLEDDLTGAWSTPVVFTVSNGIPGAPLNFTVS